MDIFEQADAFTPSRAVLQEEEEAASASAAGHLRPAVCVWNKKLVQQLYPGGLHCDILVVSTCPTSCALLQAVPGKQLLGSVLAPGVSLAGNSCGLGPDGGSTLPSDRVCCLYSAPAGPGKTALLVCCQYEVARERAPAWARSVLEQLSYGHAVFLGSMAAEQFRGQGDASQEELLFSLRTQAAQQRLQLLQQAGAKGSAPLLPTGTVVGGLPAALLSHCQVRRLSAELLVAVEMVAESRAALRESLAAALGSALRSHGAGPLADVLSSSSVLASARKSFGLGSLSSNVYA